MQAHGTRRERREGSIRRHVPRRRSRGHRLRPDLFGRVRDLARRPERCRGSRCRSGACRVGRCCRRRGSRRPDAARRSGPSSRACACTTWRRPAKGSCCSSTSSTGPRPARTSCSSCASGGGSRGGRVHAVRGLARQPVVARRLARGARPRYRAPLRLGGRGDPRLRTSRTSFAASPTSPSARASSWTATDRALGAEYATGEVPDMDEMVAAARELGS